MRGIVERWRAFTCDGRSRRRWRRSLKPSGICAVKNGGLVNIERNAVTCPDCIECRERLGLMMRDMPPLHAAKLSLAPCKDARWPINLLGAAASGVVYGLFARLSFGSRASWAVLGTMSYGFLFL